jgi:hypothetical protein
MRRVYVLGLLILTVVVLDILLFHTGAARAQQQPGFRVDRMSFPPGVSVRTAPVYGHIVGFKCLETSGGYPQCFVASSIN